MKVTVITAGGDVAVEGYEYGEATDELGRVALRFAHTLAESKEEESVTEYAQIVNACTYLFGQRLSVNGLDEPVELRAMPSYRSYGTHNDVVMRAVGISTPIVGWPAIEMEDRDSRATTIRFIRFEFGRWALFFGDKHAGIEVVLPIREHVLGPRLLAEVSRLIESARTGPETGCC